MENKSLKQNFVMSAFLSICSLVFPLVTYPYISRVLEPEGIGKIDLVLSVLNYFIGFAQLGIPIYGIRACAKVRNNSVLLKKTVQELLIINLFLALVSYVILSVCLLYIPKISADKSLYLFMSSIIILQSIGIEWYYKAIEEYTYITIRSLLCKLLSLIAMFIFVKSKNDYPQYGLICILATGLSSVFNFIHGRKIIFGFSNHKLNFMTHLKPIAIIYFMSLASSIYSNLDTVMLGFMINSHEVGIYTTSIKIKTVLIGLITSGASTLLPRVSYYLENKLYLEFERVCKKALRFIFVASIPLSVYFSIYSKECILLLAGIKFIESVKPMIILMPTILVIGFTHIIGMEILISCGKESSVFTAACTGAVVDLILNIFLIPILGACGAAIGTLAAECVVFIVEYISILKIGFINKSNLRLPFKSITFSIMFAIMSSIWVKFLNLPELIVLIISSIIFFLVFTISEALFKEPILLETLSAVLSKINRGKSA